LAVILTDDKNNPPAANPPAANTNTDIILGQTTAKVENLETANDEIIGKQEETEQKLKWTQEDINNLYHTIGELREDIDGLKNAIAALTIKEEKEEEEEEEEQEEETIIETPPAPVTSQRKHFFPFF
jgi:septal ring factor EnvC (AmiA/AmiB activator)